MIVSIIGLNIKQVNDDEPTTNGLPLAGADASAIMFLCSFVIHLPADE